MHAWEGRPFEDIAPLAARRDPRRYPVGCVTGDGDVEVVQWFRTVPELVQYLLRMEPQRWGFRQAKLIAIKPRLQPVLTTVDVTGLTEPSRVALNAETEPAYRILWWGDFGALLAGRDPWSSRLLEAADALHLEGEARADAVAAHLRARARA